MGPRSDPRTRLIALRRGRTTGARVLAITGILISLLFAYFSVRGLELEQLWAALRRYRYVYALPAAGTLAIGVALRAWRWQLLFEQRRRPRYSDVSTALLVGYLYNTILPARAGEVARVHVLGRRAGLSRAEVLATVIVERAYDIVVLVLLLALAIPFLPPVPWLSAALAVGLAAAAVLASAAALAHRSGRGLVRLLRPLRWIPRLNAERVARMTAGSIAGLEGVRRPRAAAIAVAVTAVSWAALCASTWLLLLGADIGAGAGAAALVVVATNLVLVIPSSPAALGAFEAATVVALAAHGVERADALSFALIMHALNALPYIPLGYLALFVYVRGMRRTQTTSDRL